MVCGYEQGQGNGTVCVYEKGQGNWYAGMSRDRGMIYGYELGQGNGMRV